MAGRWWRGSVGAIVVGSLVACGGGGEEEAVDALVGTDAVAEDANASAELAGADDEVEAEVAPGGTCPAATPFCHEHAGLRWSDVSDPRGNGVMWERAKQACADMGGRLPTVDELRTLGQGCPDTEPGGACKATSLCTDFMACCTSGCLGCDEAADGRYSAFGDAFPLWSKTLVQWTLPEIVWTVHYGYALVTYTSMAGGCAYRCVQ